MLAMLVLLAAGLWWWAGNDGSLSSALRWADNYAPQLTKSLTVQNPSGSLRAGGHADRITWQQGGLTVDARDVAIAWQPWALSSPAWTLSGVTLKLDSMRAASVMVDDQQPKAANSGPPESLRLPVRVVLDAFAVDQLTITGVTRFDGSGIAGSYSFDVQQHALAVTRATVASGSYRGRASLAADAPFALTAALAGTVTTALPDSQKPLLLSFEAAARGPLADLQTRASLKIISAINKVASTQPHASATARITLWSAQPIPQADAVFENLDAAALWPSAPQTLLSGNASVSPATSSITTWALQLQAANRLPGPWDKNRLPLEKLVTSAEWRGGAV